jgi:hypothetical protein
MNFDEEEEREIDLPEYDFSYTDEPLIDPPSDFDESNKENVFESELTTSQKIKNKNL